MLDMTTDKVTFLDNVVSLTRKQLLAAEGLLAVWICEEKVLTGDKLSDILSRFNQWLYHPETIPAFAVAALDINYKDYKEED